MYVYIVLGFLIAALISLAISLWKNFGMKRNKKWYWRICTLFLSLGFACFIAYIMIDSYVDENGILHEPFALLPLSFLFMFIGIVGTASRAGWEKVSAK